MKIRIKIQKPADMGPQRLVISVKAPRAGHVKTRLAQTIGAEAACAAYRRLVELLLKNLAQGGAGRAATGDVELRFTPDDALEEIQPWLREGWRSRPQGDGDLGERLKRACAEHFAEGCERLVIIGSDCPDVTAADIETAWALLALNPLTGPSGTLPTNRPNLRKVLDCASPLALWEELPPEKRQRTGAVQDAAAPIPGDLVLGPATDGGYWLIALRAPQPALFEGIPWSTDKVLAETLARAEKSGLTVSLLRELADVDTAEDWERLRLSNFEL